MGDYVEKCCLECKNIIESHNDKIKIIQDDIDKYEDMLDDLYRDIKNKCVEERRNK